MAATRERLGQWLRVRRDEHPTEGDHLDHAEAVEIVFDPRRISHRDILEFFFRIHDPTTANRHPRAVMNDQEIVFTREMEGIDAVPAHLTKPEPVSV